MSADRGASENPQNLEVKTAKATTKVTLKELTKILLKLSKRNKIFTLYSKNWSFVGSSL